jgi:hypothetical protein
VIQRKRQRERELLKKSRAALAGQTDGTLGACLNPSLNCLEDESLKDIKSPTDMLLLKKAQEVRSGGAHYLRHLATEDRVKAMQQEHKQEPTPQATKRSSPFDLLWCLAPPVEEEPNKRGEICSDQEKILVENAYAGPPADNDSGLGEAKALHAQVVQEDEGVMEEGAPKFGIMVNTETRREIDNHHPIPHKEMLRRLKKLKRRERREAAVTQVMCGVHDQRNSSRRFSAALNDGTHEEEGGCVMS